MKTSIKILIILIISMILISCEKPKCLKLNPQGYGLISTDYVGIASLAYYSCTPYNVNELTLEKYRLPSLWAIVDSSILSNLETVETSDEVFYAKYLTIGSKQFTAEIRDENIIYQSADIDDLYLWLEAEVNGKWYCEQVKLGNVYFNTINSIKYDVTICEPNVEMVNITWAGENNSLPNFSEYFIEFDSVLINQIFNRAYCNIETTKP